MIDPILQEIYSMKKQLAVSVGYDLHTLCTMLREKEKLHPERLVLIQTIIKKSKNM